MYFPLACTRLILPNLLDTNTLPYIIWCKENSKEGSVNNKGLLAPTTAINTGVTKNRISRGKQYGQELHRDWDTSCTTRISFYSVFPDALLSSPTKLHIPGSSESFAHGLAQSQDFFNEAREGLEQSICHFNLFSIFFQNEGITDAGPYACTQPGYTHQARSHCHGHC